MQYLKTVILKHAGEVRGQENDAGIATVARSCVVTTLDVKVVNNISRLLAGILARNGLLSALLMAPKAP